MEITKSIFREYDIRGIYPEEINESIVSLIAKAISYKCKEKNITEICVGRDGRLSGESLLSKLSQTLSLFGIKVINLGLVTSPHLYFAAKKNKFKSGVMITGSHNPKEYNGIKLVIDDKPISGSDILDLIENNKVVENPFLNEIVNVDIKDEYIKEVKKNLTIKKGTKIVIDCGNGAAGCIAPKLYKELGCDVIELFSDVDGNFPNHHPDPGKIENLYHPVSYTHLTLPTTVQV